MFKKYYMIGERRSTELCYILLYNIAQNQSFVQKGVGTNIKPYIYGPTREILLVLAITSI